MTATTEKERPILAEQTIAILHSLKLFGMAKGLGERLAAPGHGELSHVDFVGLLVQEEKSCRDNQRLARPSDSTPCLVARRTIGAMGVRKDYPLVAK